MKATVKILGELLLAIVIAIPIICLAGCCQNDPGLKVPDRFEVLIDQKVHSERHSNFSIMVIKDKKTDKEFRVIYNSSWGVVDDQ
jgi:hypothetical protein